MKWKFSNIEVNNQVIPAPMAGTSNPAFLRLLSELGADMAISELISAEAIVRGSKKTFNMIKELNNLDMKVGVQLFGGNPKTMASAAKMVVDYLPNISFIDINMGCPVPKVAIRSEAGSSLLKDVNKVYEVVKAVVSSVDIPVTVKIRSGWDKNSINAKEVALAIEKAGASLIAIHGRTRSDMYSGKVDLDIIKEVKESVNIPVIGNGDIKTKEDAKYMLEYTSCDAIVIGRALLGNPYFIKECIDYLDGKEVVELSLQEKLELLNKHYNYLLELKNEKVATMEIRSHFMWYLKGVPNSNMYKNDIMTIKTKDEFNLLLRRIINERCN